VSIVRTLAGVGLLSAVLIVAGCAGGDDGDAASTSANIDADASPALVGPDEFAARIEEPGVVTINVHVPDEGSIAGTDLAIPFDRIREASDLPVDRDTPLAVYCRSDNMSATAVDDLVALGYTDIVELDGGFDAWEASGRSLEPAPG
jgi:phage shock protein E